MVQFIRRLAVLSLIAGLAPADLVAQQQERSKIPEKYRWNLTEIYPDDQAWRAAKDKLVAEVPNVRPFKGTLGSSAQKLADALELGSRISKDFSRIAVYAGMMSDQDTRVSTYQGMQQEISQIGANIGADLAFVEPEILKIDPATIDKFIASEPRLKVYTLYLHDILRRREHTLSDAEERILANASVVAGGPSNIYGILSDADFPYPSVTLSDGKSVKLDSAGFSLYRTVPDRADREKVMSTFFGSLGNFRGTFGATLNGQVQSDEFYAKARNYKSALESSLDAANIPTLRVHAAHRRGESEPADVPPLSCAAQADDGAVRAPLLRPVRPAGVLGRPDLQRRRSGTARHGGVEAARR